MNDEDFDSRDDGMTLAKNNIKKILIEYRFSLAECLETLSRVQIDLLRNHTQACQKMIE